jgi:hypothetical protein
MSIGLRTDGTDETKRSKLGEGTEGILDQTHAQFEFRQSPNTVTELSSTRVHSYSSTLLE